MIRFDDIHKSFPGPNGSVEVLKGLTLRVDPSEFVAVRGASGCGKSTMLLIVGTLLKPDSGYLSITGMNPTELSSTARARFRAETIGFVFQQFYLLPYLSVLDNVLSADTPLRRDGAETRARELLERFGMSHRFDHLPGQLSMGEQQRAALARAMLNEPKILLADEPTGNLDEDNGQLVLDYLAEFAESGGAVLMVTHDTRAAERATRMVTLQSGTFSWADGEG